MKISISGCGWLGQPLAQHLKQQNHAIFATKRKVEDLPALTAQGFSALQYSLGDDLDSNALAPLFATDVFVLNIPPGRKNMQQMQGKADFTERMLALIERIDNSCVQQLIFISTTSVYGDQAGTITEHSALTPNTASGQAHVEIEQAVMQQMGERTCVLRLAGLVGFDRHPIRTLAGRENLSNGKTPVNLIHQTDVIRTIAAIIGQKQRNKYFHLCSKEHPTRQDYYRWSAEQLGLIAPSFVQGDERTGKEIDASWTLNELGLTLNYASPYEMLDGLKLT